MSRFSEKEKSLLEEMFISSARITAEVTYGNMDSEKFQRYTSFFNKRYAELPGKDSLIKFLMRNYHLRLAEDFKDCNPFSMETENRNGFSYNTLMSFEEIVILAKLIFKTKEYDKYYDDILKKGSARIQTYNVNDPAQQVVKIVGFIVAHLLCFKHIFNVCEERCYIINALDELSDALKNKMFGRLSEIEESIVFQLFDDIYSELYKSNSLYFDGKENELKKKEA